ncbi:hypothetical protein L2E82_49655 [Cichorium intybus]|uniref:Uncharacterized protein n=1 Tax=Cichorium intybus TaxID=13427 RepID=A0ACB8Z171_CICIN|nr:hypothetical protein L2E82_49655 [Cichorium intybus]
METKLSHRVYNGPILLLLLLYCDAVKCEAVKLTRKIPVISMWTTDDLENREMEEIMVLDWGKLISLEVKNLVLLKTTGSEPYKLSLHEPYKPSLHKEYGEKFERLFEIVLDAKNSMEEIVYDCMEKFPNENRTTEFIKRMKDLFTEDDNEDDFGAELDRDVNVLEEGGSGDVGNQDNLNEGGDDDRIDVHDVKGKKILSELDEERGVQKKYDSFDGGSKLNDEKLLVQFLLRCSEDDDRREVLFETSSGDVLFRQDFESMRPLSPINRNVIDCWSCILNHQESLTGKSSRRFLYLNSSIMSEDTLNVSTPSKRSYEIFNNRMERFISHVQRSLEFNELKLVFFPIKDEKNLYCLVFNLEKVDYILLDSTNYGAPGMRIYGNIPLLLTIGYKKMNLIKKVTPRRVLVPWQETHATQDNGVFLMRHMETYIGQEDNNWTVGLVKQESKRDKRLTNLRILYIVRLAMHEININRSKLQEHVLEFGKIDFATRDSLMNKGFACEKYKGRTVSMIG